MQYKKALLVGVKGCGMKWIAKILKSKGAIVQGTGLEDIKFTSQLYEYLGTHGIEQLQDDIDCVVYSGILKNKPEVVEAKRRGIHTYHRGEFLSKSIVHHIGVTGTHGKTYTTGLLGYIFDDYCTILGGEYIDDKNNKTIDVSLKSVVEIDESDESIYYFHPKILVVPSVTFDHVQFHKSKENYLHYIEKFINSINGIVIMQYDDYKKMNIKAKVYTYGFNKEADFYIDGDYIPKLNKKLFVRDKIRKLNHTAALIVSHLEGRDNIDDEYLSKFSGVRRRFEIEKYKGYTIINDYGHHPTEIENTLERARIELGHNKFTVFHQGHSDNRLEYFLEEYKRVLKDVDELILLPIHTLQALNEEYKSNYIEEIIKSHKNARYSKDGAIDVKNKEVIFFSAGNIDTYISGFKSYVENNTEL